MAGSLVVDPDIAAMLIIHRTITSGLVVERCAIPLENVAAAIVHLRSLPVDPCCTHGVTGGCLGLAGSKGLFKADLKAALDVVIGWLLVELDV